MAFTAGQIENIANSALDYYFGKGEAFKQSLQKRPWLDKLERSKKSFPGGKGKISLAVVGEFGDGSGNDVIKGYTTDDAVGFYNPANTKRAEYPWREVHIGISLTHTELKVDGLSVSDTNGESVSNHSNRELTALVNIFEEKLFAMGEQYARSSNKAFYQDGASDAKGFVGLAALVKDNPAAGTVGGLSCVDNKWWRNRARTASYAAAVTATPGLAGHGGDAVTSNTADGGAVLQVLQYEYRQLTRFGGQPNFAVVGSDFLDAMEKELRANGIYTQKGFDSDTDVSMGALKFMNTTFVYDPTLDDLSLAKRCYWLDTNAIFLMAMESEWRKQHSPARPADKFVMYRSLTSTGQLVAKQLNSSLVLDIK